MTPQMAVIAIIDGETYCKWFRKSNTTADQIITVQNLDVQPGRTSKWLLLKPTTHPHKWIVAPCRTVTKNLEFERQKNEPPVPHWEIIDYGFITEGPLDRILGFLMNGTATINSQPYPL